jgi:hypothetical protein
VASSEPKDIGQIFRDGTLIDEAMNAAVRDAVQLHKEKGLPLVVWRDGKTRWISPEEAERDLARSSPRPGENSASRSG